MKFREFGTKGNKPIMLLHGGGLSWWSLKPHIQALKNDYFIIAPTIDGHGDDSQTTFTSIEECADKIVNYINDKLDGKLYCICGLSIGAQIAAEVLSRKVNIAHKAVIESGLFCPMQYVASMAKPMYGMSYGLIKQKWFSKYQAKALYVPEEMFEQYYEDSCKMSKESLINMTISNSTYSIPKNIKNSEAETLIIVGGKELSAMKKSAQLLHDTINNSTLTIIDKNSHGELSLKTPDKYIKMLLDFLN
ncbi:MAG: alpha/beta hydrolase [Eubacteriales bacterium]